MVITVSRSRLITTLLVAVGLVVGFAAGIMVQKHATPKIVATATSNRPGGQFGFGSGGGSGGGFANRGGARPTFGTVSSVTATQMVISTQAGTPATVLFSGNPTVTDASGNASSVGAIATGDTVVVTGTAASDGTITATRIRITQTAASGG